jgi:hypothetical protein
VVIVGVATVENGVRIYVVVHECGVTTVLLTHESPWMEEELIGGSEKVWGCFRDG